MAKLTEVVALKADIVYVDNKIKTDIPINAVFTDTVYDDTVVSNLVSTNTDAITLLNSDDTVSGSVDSKVKVVSNLVSTNTDAITLLQPKIGDTISRPSTPTIGMAYYDTDLKRPIWYDGTDWTDALGTII